MTSKVAIDPFVGSGEQPEREAAATPVATTGAGKAEAFDLAAARKRLAFLEQRLWDLEGASKKARSEEAALLKELDTRQAKLAAGQITVDVVTSVSSELREIREAGQHLQQAIESVKAKHGDLAARISQDEARLEQLRQEDLAGPLKAKREELVAGFISNLAGLLTPLQEAEELWEKIARDFPLATQPAPLTIDSLAARTLTAWPKTGRFVEPAASIYQVAAIGRYLAAIIRGPFAGIGTEEDRILRRLGGK